MKRGDIYFVSLDPSQGHEQRGDRPVLIISHDKFNQKTKTPIVLPITTGSNFARTSGFSVSLDGKTKATVGIVRCDQPRAIDMIARKGKYIDSVSEDVLSDVLARMVSIIF